MPIPPRAHGPPLIGNSIRLLRNPIGYTLECARKYGDIVDLNIPILPIWLINHPDLIEHVLVHDNRSYHKDATTQDLRPVLGNGLLLSEGDFWRRQRRLAQPAFHRERVASYADVMVHYTERMLTTWAVGQVREVHQDMMQLTREIVAKTLFDADITKEAKDIGDALAAVVQRFIDVPPGVPLLARLPTPGKRRFQRAVQTLDDVILRIVAERRKTKQDTGDLLSMLIQAIDEGEGMADTQLRDEAITLFLAGHETTAAVLSWTWALLSQNPMARQALDQEINDVLGHRLPQLQDIPKLFVANNIISESMRIYPPAWALGREAITDTTLGPYHVHKGMQIWFSQYVMHRDPRWFKDPESFVPDRWKGDFAKQLPKYAYFPFGGGPRLCIGNSFALMEAILLLVTIAQRFHLALLPGQSIQPKASVTLRPQHGVRVVLKKR